MVPFRIPMKEFRIRRVPVRLCSRSREDPRILLISYRVVSSKTRRFDCWRSPMCDTGFGLASVRSRAGRPRGKPTTWRRNQCGQTPRGSNGVEAASVPSPVPLLRSCIRGKRNEGLDGNLGGEGRGEPGKCAHATGASASDCPDFHLGRLDYAGKTVDTRLEAGIEFT